MAFRTIVLPFEGHSRQSQLMHLQVKCAKEFQEILWLHLIEKKISNQSRALSIMGLEGAEKIMSHVLDITIDNVEMREALAAKEYFAFYHLGLNRRVDDPINSRLNYGYAVMRSSIARAIVATGFHPTFGIHHDNQLNVICKTMLNY